MDHEVEEEVEGSSKWTERALMLHSGHLTAVQVEENKHGWGIQRIRARLDHYPTSLPNPQVWT